MKRFNFYMPDDLYERISIMARKYNLSRTKMAIKLLEIGYIRFLYARNKLSKLEEK